MTEEKKYKDLGKLVNLIRYVRKFMGVDIQSYPHNFEISDLEGYSGQLNRSLNTINDKLTEIVKHQELFFRIIQNQSFYEEDLINNDLDSYIKIKNIIITNPRSQIEVSSLNPSRRENPTNNRYVTERFQMRFSVLIEFFENNGNIKSYTFNTSDICFHLLKFSPSMYNITQLKVKIREIEEEVEVNQKQLDKARQSLESYKWIESFMEENKIIEEEKNTLKTKLIMSIMTDEDSENDISTNISEVVALDI